MPSEHQPHAPGRPQQLVPPAVQQLRPPAQTSSRRSASSFIAAAVLSELEQPGENQLKQILSELEKANRCLLQSDDGTQRHAPMPHPAVVVAHDSAGSIAAGASPTSSTASLPRRRLPGIVRRQAFPRATAVVAGLSPSSPSQRRGGSPRVVTGRGGEQVGAEGSPASASSAGAPAASRAAMHSGSAVSLRPSASAGSFGAPERERPAPRPNSESPGEPHVLSLTMQEKLRREGEAERSAADRDREALQAEHAAEVEAVNQRHHAEKEELQWEVQELKRKCSQLLESRRSEPGDFSPLQAALRRALHGPLGGPLERQATQANDELAQQLEAMRRRCSEQQGREENEVEELRVLIRACRGDLAKSEENFSSMARLFDEQRRGQAKASLRPSSAVLVPAPTVAPTPTGLSSPPARRAASAGSSAAGSPTSSGRVATVEAEWQASLPPSSSASSGPATVAPQAAGGTALSGTAAPAPWETLAGARAAKASLPPSSPASSVPATVASQAVGGAALTGTAAPAPRETLAGARAAKGLFNATAIAATAERLTSSGSASPPPPPPPPPRSASSSTLFGGEARRHSVQSPPGSGSIPTPAPAAAHRDALPGWGSVPAGFGHCISQANGGMKAATTALVFGRGPGPGQSSPG